MRCTYPDCTEQSVCTVMGITNGTERPVAHLCREHARGFAAFCEEQGAKVEHALERDPLFDAFAEREQSERVPAHRAPLTPAREAAVRAAQARLRS